MRVVMRYVEQSSYQKLLLYLPPILPQLSQLGTVLNRIAMRAPLREVDCSNGQRIILFAASLMRRTVATAIMRSGGGRSLAGQMPIPFDRLAAPIHHNFIRLFSYGVLQLLQTVGETLYRARHEVDLQGLLRNDQARWRGSQQPDPRHLRQLLFRINEQGQFGDLTDDIKHGLQDPQRRASRDQRHRPKTSARAVLHAAGQE